MDRLAQAAELAPAEDHQVLLLAVGAEDPGHSASPGVPDEHQPEPHMDGDHDDLGEFIADLTCWPIGIDDDDGVEVS